MTWSIDKLVRLRIKDLRLSASKIKLILPIVVVLVFTGLIFINVISADSTDFGKPETTQNIELNIDGSKTTFVLEKYRNGDSIDFWLKKKAIFGQKPVIKLSGFESDVSVCDQPVIDLGDNAGQGICFVGDVGAHSRNIQVIKFRDNKFSVFKISQDGSSAESVVSDVPQFNFADKNNDGLIDLIVDQRDYDTDPLNNIIRSIYYGNGSGFSFDSSENIPYN